MKDGGPAFPEVFSTFDAERQKLTDVYSAGGMSLYDYYVGKALQGFCANPAIFASNPTSGWDLVNSTFEQLVATARELAAITIKARSPSPERDRT